MSRLQSLKPTLATLPKALATTQPDGAQPEPTSRNNVPWRKWYGLARWKRLRWEVLVEAAFTCCLCRRLESNTSKLVADHKIPHRGRDWLFWDKGNLQCLCEVCHSTTKQSEEQAQPIGAWD